MLKEARIEGLVDELEKIAILPGMLRIGVPSAGKLMARGAGRAAVAGGGLGAVAGGVHGGLSEKGTVLGGALKGGLVGAGLGAGVGAGAGKLLHRSMTGTFKPNTFMGSLQHAAWKNPGLRREAFRGTARVSGVPGTVRPTAGLRKAPIRM